MKKIIIYRAFDGEDFYDEQTCAEYEQKYLDYGREFVAATRPHHMAFQIILGGIFK